MIHVLSDLHLEFSPHSPGPAAKEADVVVLAGDIDVRARGVSWAAKAFRCPVLYVPGNHEYYKGNLQLTLRKMREQAADTPNVKVLDCDEHLVAGVRFLGATTWTDYTSGGQQPLAVWEAETRMNDFRRIKAGAEYRRVRPADFIQENVKARKWLTSHLHKPFAGRTVVITHHAPVTGSLGEGRRPSLLDTAYANAWDDLMGLSDIWIHGHIHQAHDFEVGSTRIIANPRGYPGEATGFDPKLLVTV